MYTRCVYEPEQPLAVYRRQVLVKRHHNFYGSNEYNTAREAFVYKAATDSTPENIAIHRKPKVRLKLFAQLA